MLKLRKAEERGVTKTDWLTSYHSFSFGHYHDQNHMGFGPLRVINDDTVIGGAGFGEHGHRDMEIISYVTQGTLAHKDSMGNGSVIQAGDVQIMRAGTGIRHSEFNDNADQEVKFHQIWIMPNQNGLEPGYQQQNFGNALEKNSLTLIASGDPDKALHIHQDADLYLGRFDAEVNISQDTDTKRKYWIQVLSGNLGIEDITLETGDGLAIEDEDRLTLSFTKDSEILLFDMAA